MAEWHFEWSEVIGTVLRHVISSVVLSTAKR